MDSKIRKMIEMCRYEDDPSWDVMKGLFAYATFEKYEGILANRDKVVKKAILGSEAERVTSNHDFEKSVKEKIGFVEAIDNLLILGSVEIPSHRIAIKAPTYIGKGARLTDSIIYSPSYVGAGAEIEHSRIVSQRATYIGDNAKISHLEELRGCFISGGPIREQGREKTYMHARSLNNTIVGAYSGISVGTDVYNHPLMGEKALKFDPETRNLIESDERKLPILVGLEASIGAHCLINTGAIIGARARVPSRTDVIGYQSDTYDRFI